MPASTTIWVAELAKGSVQNTPKRTRSETIITPRLGSRSRNGPKKRPTTTAGRNSTNISAPTHGPESVRSLTSTTSATVASSVPRLEPSVAKKSRRKPDAVPRRLNCRRTPFTPSPSVSGSRRRRPKPCERFRQECVLVRHTHSDADRVRRAEARERPHDHSLAQQCVEERLRVVADLEVQEVAYRRTDDVVAGVAQKSLQLGAAARVYLTPARKLVGRVETCERRFLRRRGEVERAPRLPQRSHELCCGDAVANTQAGEAVDLRERAQHDYVAAGFEVFLDPIGVVGIVDVLEVRLVEDGE